MLGTAPTQYQSILGVLLRARYTHIIIIIQLLVRGGQYPRFIVFLVWGLELGGCSGLRGTG